MIAPLRHEAMNLDAKRAKRIPDLWPRVRLNITWDGCKVCIGRRGERIEADLEIAADGGHTAFLH